MTSHLDPAIGGQDLSIPAIAGVVRHLRVLVLTEPKALALDSAGQEEELRAGHVVPERLIVHHASRHCFSDGDFPALLLASLIGLREQRHFHVGDRLEAVMGLLVRVHEMLNFSHHELPHAKKPGAGGNLVPEPETDLCSGERHLARVVLQQATEVREDPLSCLGAQIPDSLASRPNGRDEHQVERKRFGQFISGVRGANIQFGENFPELFLTVGISIAPDRQKLGLPLGAHRLLRV
mmetsp:Transcript_11467/g.12980  ORF Transcript_11467/g.12980 Transcript_11467/m.12980 type:complete len:237 (+) Transcript_11467:836-1546(+)